MRYILAIYILIVLLPNLSSGGRRCCTRPSSECVSSSCTDKQDTANTNKITKDPTVSWSILTSIRTWTDISGVYHLQARFVGFDGHDVRLRGTNQQLYAIEIEKLSYLDAILVRSSGQASTTPQ